MTNARKPRMRGGHVFYCDLCNRDRFFYSIRPDVPVECGTCGNTVPLIRLRDQVRNLEHSLHASKDMPG